MVWVCVCLWGLTCFGVPVLFVSHATPHTQEAAQEAAFLQILAQVRDSARETERALLSGHINRHQADVLRGRYRATTRALLEALLHSSSNVRTTSVVRPSTGRCRRSSRTRTLSSVPAIVPIGSPKAVRFSLTSTVR